MRALNKSDRRLPLWTLAGSLVLFLGTAPSCSGPCEKYYDMAKKCVKVGKGKDESKADFVKACKKDKTARKVAEKCGKLTGCDKFVKCLGDAMEDGMKKAMDDAENERAKKLSALLAKKKWEDFLLECFMYRKQLKPDARKVCHSGQIAYVNAGGNKTAAPKLRTEVLRFCGRDESSFAGKGVAPACESVKVSEVIAAVDKTLKADKHLTIPVMCSIRLEELEKSKHANAKANRARLLQACYVKLGKAILEKMLKKSAKICTLGGELLYKAVKKYKVKDPALDPLMEKAKAACEK